MTLLELLPTLDDDELANLWDNARRLIEAGDDARRESAMALLPAIEKEAAERKARRKEAVARRTAARLSGRALPAERGGRAAQPNAAH